MCAIFGLCLSLALLGELLSNQHEIIFIVNTHGLLPPALSIIIMFYRMKSICYKVMHNYIVWGAVCLKTTQTSMFSTGIDVQQKCRCLASLSTFSTGYSIHNQCLDDRDSEVLIVKGSMFSKQSMFSKRLTCLTSDRCFSKSSMFTKLLTITVTAL